MNSNTKQHRHTNIFVRLSIVSLLLLVILAPINAQSFNSTSSYRTNSRQADVTPVDMSVQYKSYESTIYEPFAEESPSRIGNRRNTDNNYTGDVDLGDWGDPDIENPGNQSGEYPLGDAWVMLLFAAAAAIFVYRKRVVAQKNN